MGLTTDKSDPELHEDRGDGQNKKYIVLSEEERAKGFVRPVRNGYVHVGPPGPRFPLRDITPEERLTYGQYGYEKYEEYPESERPKLGRWWTQRELDLIAGSCGALTIMAREIAETYARDPSFYGATYCMKCRKHLPVGAQGEFVWPGTDIRVGT